MGLSAIASLVRDKIEVEGRLPFLEGGLSHEEITALATGEQLAMEVYLLLPPVLSIAGDKLLNILIQKDDLA